jgi:hypothetical protein
LRVVGAVAVAVAVAPGVDVVVACSILIALEGGEGSVEFVRSWIASCCGFADEARGGLSNILVRSRHWIDGWMEKRLLSEYLHRLCFCAFWSLSCDLDVLYGQEY